MHKFIVRSFSARWTSARKSITQSDSRFHPNVFILHPVTGKSLSTVSNTQSVIRLIDPIYESAVWMEWQVTFNSLKLVSLHPSEPFHLKHSTFACVCDYYKCCHLYFFRVICIHMYECVSVSESQRQNVYFVRCVKLWKVAMSKASCYVISNSGNLSLPMLNGKCSIRFTSRQIYTNH